MTYPPSTPGRHHFDEPAPTWASASSEQPWLPPQQPGYGGYPPAPDQDWRGPAPAAHQPPPVQQPPLPPPPQPAAAPPPSQNTPWYEGPLATTFETDEFWKLLRQQVAMTCNRDNATLSQAAFNTIGQRREVSPHAVILFFAGPPRPQRRFDIELYAMQRTAFADADHDDLGRLLPGYTKAVQRHVATAVRTGRPWHPRGPQDSFANGGQMDLPVRRAGFVGAALTTLDTAEAPWSAVSDSVRRGTFGSTFLGLPGQSFIRLIDGTAIHAKREQNRTWGDDGFRANRPIGVNAWRTTTDVTVDPRFGPQSVWRDLAALTETLAGYLCRQPTDLYTWFAAN